MRTFIFIFTLLVAEKTFAQTYTVEARMEIAFKKHLSLSGQTDTLQIYPSPKEISGTFKSTAFINPCFTKLKKPFTPEEKRAILKRLQGKLSEDERYFDISFTDADPLFAKLWMDTLVFYWQIFLVENVIKKFNERENFLIAQVYLERELKTVAENEFTEWIQKNDLIQYDVQCGTVSNKIKYLDSLKQIDEHCIAGIHGLQNRLLKKDPIQINMPNIYLGIENTELLDLYKKANEIQSDSTKKQSLDLMVKEILIYLTNFEKTIQFRLEQTTRTYIGYKHKASQLQKFEDEYLHKTNRKLEYTKRLKRLEDQLYYLRLMRSGFTPFMQVIEAPHKAE